MSLHSSNKCKISRSPLRRKLVLLFFFNLILGFFFEIAIYSHFFLPFPLYMSSSTSHPTLLQIHGFLYHQLIRCVYTFMYTYIFLNVTWVQVVALHDQLVCAFQGVTTTLAHNLTQTPLALCVVLRFVGCSPSGLSCPLVSSLLLHNFAVTLVRLNGYNF